MACLAQPFDYELYCLLARAVVGGLVKNIATWVEVARPERFELSTPRSVVRSNTVSDKVTGRASAFIQALRGFDSALL